MTTLGALSSAVPDLIASSIRTKSPAELITTADRIEVAPLGTPTKDGVLPNPDGISHTVALADPLLLA